MSEICKNCRREISVNECYSCRCRICKICDCKSCFSCNCRKKGGCNHCLICWKRKLLNCTDCRDSFFCKNCKNCESCWYSKDMKFCYLCQNSKRCINCDKCIKCIECKSCKNLDGWEGIENYDPKEFIRTLIKNIEEIQVDVKDIMKIFKSGTSFYPFKEAYKNEDGDLIFENGTLVLTRLEINEKIDLGLFRIRKDEELLKQLLLYRPDFTESLPKEFIRSLTLKQKRKQKSARK